MGSGYKINLGLYSKIEKLMHSHSIATLPRLKMWIQLLQTLRL